MLCIFLKKRSGTMFRIYAEASPDRAEVLEKAASNATPRQAVGKEFLFYFIA
jgi:hypothetical protein